MIKTLRKKFIWISMISVTLVIVAIVAVINIINYNNVINTVDARLDILTENNGEYPGVTDNKSPDGTQNPSDTVNSNQSPSDSSDNKVPTKPDDSSQSTDSSDSSNDATKDNSSKKSSSGKNSDNQDLSKKKGFSQQILSSAVISEESAFDTRYFTVTISKKGKVTSYNVDSIAAVSSDEAKEMALNLYEKNSSDGMDDGYRYKTISVDGGTMYIFIDCTREMSSFKSFLYISILISVIGIGLVLVLILVFSKIVVKPVSESYEKQKQFITDASHELKTPLAIIDANADVLEMELDSEDNKWIKSIKKQTARLLSLTEKLVFLSRMDEENSRIELIDLDFSKIALEVCESFEGIATQKSKDYSYNIAEGIHLKGDQKTLTQLVSLLVDNAMKYSDDNGKIQVDLSKSGKNAKLLVYNTVDSIEPGKHNELFERFYRMDSSRNSKTGGYGIGLSVVAAVAKNYKGKASCQSKDDHSIEFEIIL